MTQWAKPTWAADKGKWDRALALKVRISCAENMKRVASARQQ